MSKHAKISLPLREPDGSTVHRTLNGEWLVGTGMSKGTPGLGNRESHDEQKQWGRALWFVIRSASGKMVVYKRPSIDVAPPSVEIYDSFEAMQPHVPPSIYDEAMQKAGLKEPPQFREVPLEGV